LQNAFKSDRYKAGAFPVTEKLCANVISLPMHTELSNETLKYITESILDFCKK
jgi:dTDP-4-amino-4,6-dideoxygalactose transaminase